jgi:hypothetical protein
MGLDGLSVLHTHPDNPGVEDLLETGTGKEDLLALRSFEKPSAKPKEVVTHLWVEGYLGQRRKNIGHSVQCDVIKGFLEVAFKLWEAEIFDAKFN